MAQDTRRKLDYLLFSLTLARLLWASFSLNYTPPKSRRGLWNTVYKCSVLSLHQSARFYIITLSFHAVCSKLRRVPLEKQTSASTKELPEILWRHNRSTSVHRNWFLQILDPASSTWPTWCSSYLNVLPLTRLSTISLLSLNISLRFSY
jgi:hypothetical protein